MRRYSEILQQGDIKGGRSANKFLKSQIRQFPVLNFYFSEFARMWQFADLRFADSVIFCWLKNSANSQIQNFSPYKYQLKMLFVV
jgi:hypothetical protein